MNLDNEIKSLLKSIGNIEEYLKSIKKDNIKKDNDITPNEFVQDIKSGISQIKLNDKENDNSNKIKYDPSNFIDSIYKEFMKMKNYYLLAMGSFEKVNLLSNKLNKPFKCISCDIKVNKFKTFHCINKCIQNYKLIILQLTKIKKILNDERFKLFNFYMDKVQLDLIKEFINLNDLICNMVIKINLISNKCSNYKIMLIDKKNYNLISDYKMTSKLSDELNDRLNDTSNNNELMEEECIEEYKNVIDKLPSSNDLQDTLNSFLDNKEKVNDKINPFHLIYSESESDKSNEENEKEDDNDSSNEKLESNSESNSMEEEDNNKTDNENDTSNDTSNDSTNENSQDSSSSFDVSEIPKKK